MPDEVLTAPELAKYLKVHPSTIYRLLKARKLPAFRIGSDWRFNREHIDEWRIAQEKSFEAGTPRQTQMKSVASDFPLGVRFL